MIYRCTQYNAITQNLRTASIVFTANENERVKGEKNDGISLKYLALVTLKKYGK